MAVYIDSFEAPFRNMVMCHMIADSREELYTMVDKIGVKRKWIQKIDTCYEHFDICLSKKQLAIKFGAVEIDSKNLINRMLAKKVIAQAHPSQPQSPSKDDPEQN